VTLVALFDGLVSCLRTHGVREVHDQTEGLDAKDYQGKIGELESTAGPIPITHFDRSDD